MPLKAPFWTISVFGLLGWNIGALAYIPPSQFILKTWANKHSGIKGLRVKTLVTAYDGSRPTEYHFKETIHYDPGTQTVRSWATDDSEKKLYYMEKKVDRLSTAGRLLVSSDWHELTQTLREKGIPVKPEHDLLNLRTEADRMKAENQALLRWNGTFAWVIGATPSMEPNSPQIWFEKDTFLPMRMVYATTDGDSLVDVRYENYRFAREVPYPRTVLILSKGDTLFSSQLVDVAVEAAHLTGGNPGFTEAGNSAGSGVRSLIRTYYEKFR